MLMCISDLPPSQGGRYAGFGNTVQPQSKDSSDYWSSWSSVSKFNHSVLFMPNGRMLKIQIKTYKIVLLKCNTEYPKQGLPN